MKKMRLLLVTLICSMWLCSCQKPDGGDQPGSWMATDTTCLGTCSVIGDLDLAVYSVRLDPANVQANQVQLKSVELLYGPEGQVSEGNVRKLQILRDTVLNSIFARTDTLWNLVPNTTYAYRLVISDAVFSDTTRQKTFQTQSAMQPLVTVDTAFISDGRIQCNASVIAHWRSMLDDIGYTLNLYWGTDSLTIDQPMEDVEVVYEGLEDKLIYKSFTGSIPVGADTSLWFKAYVKDSWEWETTSTPVQLILSDQPYVTIVKHDQTGPVSFCLKGNAVKGSSDVILYRCGFCYGQVPRPTLDNLFVEAASNQWGSFTVDLEDLAYNTSYYYRAFIQITDENGPIYYSDGSGQFSTDAAPVSYHVEMIDLSDIYTNPLLPIQLIEPNKAYVLAKMLDGSLNDVREYGFVWKHKVEGEDETVTLENCLGHVMGEDASHYPMLTMVPGLPDLTGAFLKQLTDMGIETEYWVGAYLIMRDESIVYSTPIVLKMPGE